MPVFHRIRIGISSIALGCILLTGCGEIPQPVPNETEASPVDYRLNEEELSAAEEAMTAEVLQNDNWSARETEAHFWNGSRYVLSQLTETEAATTISRGACIQVLAPPYAHWEQYVISYEWGDNPSMLVEALAGAAPEGVLLERRSLTEEKRYLEYFRWDGTSEILLEIPEEVYGASWYQTAGKLWAVSADGGELTVFNESGQRDYSRNLTGKVMGILENPSQGSTLWYGFEQEELVLWDEPDGQIQLRVTDEISQYEDFSIAYSPAGELFLADANHVWIYEENGVRELFSFLEEDYPVEKLYGVSFQENGDLRFLVEYGGTQHLLTAKAADLTETVERQEITVVVNIVSIGLQKMAADYNRANNKYRVTIITVEEEENPEDYRRRIQLEMAAGKGPDLLAEYAINVQESAAQGYLEPLDGLLEDTSSFFASALETGKVGDITYGIPYGCFPYFLTVSGQLTDASSWTLEQMYETVENSSAEVLEEGADGVDILMLYGLYDEENKALIDWENGESHLAEEPFLELLAFAREYADRGDYPAEEVGERLLDGRIAGERIGLYELSQLLKAESAFGGNAVFIGYPRSSGNGIYMATDRLYLNRNAANKEGAMDFLHYLLSEEAQLCYAEYAGQNRLPVRRSAMEHYIEQYQQNVAATPVQRYDGRGIYWQEERVDEEQIRQLWWILDNAVPAVFRANEIWSIVEEETRPYFEGVRSAEEAAAALDSRVQLYLDERK